MNRTDTLRRISAICRGDFGACLWALGYVSLDMPQHALEELLEALEEFLRVNPTPLLGDHLVLVRERFGIPKP